jgi:hypothetical protein
MIRSIHQSGTAAAGAAAYKRGSKGGFIHAYIHMSLVDSSMESAALLACINPPLLPLLYASRAAC